MHTRETISKELKRIQDSVPKMMRDFTLIKVAKSPEIEMVFKKALESPDVSEKKKEYVRSILESGKLSQEKITENPKVAKMRDEYVQREINKSVKAGRLPSKKEFRRIMALHDDKKGISEGVGTKDTE